MMKKVILVLFFFFAANTYAEDCKITATNDGNYARKLAILFELMCFGKSNDKDPFTKKVNLWVKAPSNDLHTSRDVSKLQVTALKYLETIDGNLRIIHRQSDDKWNDIFATTLERLSESRKKLTDYANGIEATQWQIDDLCYFDQSVDLKPIISNSCKAGFNDDCELNLGTASELLRQVHLTYKILNKLVATVKIAPLYRKVAKLDEQWDYYFEEGRSQYVWELLLNSWLYSESLGDDKLDPPPDWQWILFHPSAAIEFFENDENDNSNINAIGIIELFGYNRLKWGKDSLLNDWPLGISVIASISLSSQGDRIGYGGMVHFKNKYSVGLTQRNFDNGNEIIWLFSVDFGDFFLNVEDDTKKKFRKMSAL